MSKATLYGVKYSPWTERARWALDHHKIPYKYREHVPFLGEPLLKMLARGTGRDKATVPLYRDGQQAIGDSLEIIEHVEKIGQGPALLRKDVDAQAWVERLEPILQIMRQRVTRRTLNNPEALREAAAGAVPGFMANLFKPVAAMGTRHIASKYGFEAAEASGETREPDLTAMLEEIRARLDGGDYLHGEFSAADIFAATLLHGVKPPASPHFPKGSATRAAWTHDGIAEEFADLVAWRDGLYAKHR